MKKGFTLIEMVVVLAILAILAAVLTPMITGYVARAKISAASTDIKKIIAAVVQFNTDTKTWPIYSTQPYAGGGDAIYDVLASPGNPAQVPMSGNGSDWPSVSGLVAGNIGELDDVLNKNRMTMRTWNGPYMELSADPWDTKYYYTAKFQKPGVTSTHGITSAAPTPSAIYIISAGPNQTIETNFDQATSAFVAGGDDIIARIK